MNLEELFIAFMLIESFAISWLSVEIIILKKKME